jgi:hypothetical protein
MIVINPKNIENSEIAALWLLEKDVHSNKVEKKKASLPALNVFTTE